MNPDKKTKLNLVLVSLIVGLILPIALFGQPIRPVPAGGDGGGSNPIQERRDTDKQQTETEAKELQRLQEEDVKACEEEEGKEFGVEPSQKNGDRGGRNPYDPSNPDSPYHDPNYDPNGDDDEDGIPNNQDEDADGNGVPDVDERPAPAMVCNLLSQYIAANEGWYNQKYYDTEGYPTIGIGHLITGNEPSDITKNIQETGEIDDEQVLRLFSVDLSTYQNCAPRVAGEKGVNWGSLTRGRQIVLTDMAFNLGCVKLGKFTEMWKNIAEAQNAGSDSEEELSWRDAANEILDSTYASQVGQRASRNAKIMETKEEGSESSPDNNTQLGILRTKVNSESRVTNKVCGGSRTAWENPFKLLTDLFQTPIALAQGLYVPVIEQDGVLRRDTTKIRENTGKIEEHTDNIRMLSIQICTHLRAIRRIQSRFELKMTEDAQVKRIRDTELEKYRQAVFGENGLVKTGYTMLDENGNAISAPSFVLDTRYHWEYRKKEAEEVTKDKITQTNKRDGANIVKAIESDNPFSLNNSITNDDLINLKLKEQTEVVASLNNKQIPLLSSIIKPVKKLAFLITGNTVWATEETTTDNYQQKYWASWLKTLEPKNNRLGSYMIALDNINAERNLAVSAAKQEALQGQGFLPIRECKIKTSDGKNCAVWKTIQPAIIVKDTASKAINSRLDVYMNAKEKGDIGTGNEPDITEVIENKPSTRGGGAVGPGMTTPEDVPSTNEDIESDEAVNNPNDSNTGGGQGERNTENVPDWGGILNGLGNFFGRNDDASDGDMNWLVDLINALKRLVGTIWSILRPLMVLDYKIKEGYTLIYWFSPNAGYCQAVNDWSSTDRPEGIAVDGGVKLSSTPVSGANGAIIGSIKIVPPAGTTRYEIKCFNGNGSRIKSKDVKK